MIGGGAALFEDLNFAIAALGDAGEHVQKIFAKDVAGTTAGDENSAGLEEFDGEAVDAVVGHESVVDGGAVAGEFRRIENDEAESLALSGEFLQHLEAIASAEMEIRQAVELGVGAGKAEGLFAAVDTEDFGCAAVLDGVQGKAAAVAEHVEYAAVMCVVGDGAAVVALI